jgi:Tol biopolymer transport system component
MRPFFLALLTVLLTAPALGQPATTTAPTLPELFGEGVFSTSLYELTPAFTPDGQTAYTTISTPTYGDFFVIVESHYENGSWTEPTTASFSGRYSDADPFVSPDGSTLYYLSKRPVEAGGEPRSDYDMWKVERTGGGWSDPIHLGPTVNTDGNEYFPTVDAEGTLYFAAEREGGEGYSDIYRAAPDGNGGYEAPENLGSAVNSKYHDTTPYISPDGQTLIFAVFGNPEGEGSAELYVSRRENGAWTEAKHLGPVINSPGRDYCPIVGPEGEWLYFTSPRTPGVQPNGKGPVDLDAMRAFYEQPQNGFGNAYRVRLDALP